MFITMNRFRVKKGEEKGFENVWLNRDVHLKDERGFVEFHMLRGPENDDHTLYVSHTIWESEQTFIDWTKSEAFRNAHKNAGQNKPLYIGAPQFEGFEVIQKIGR